MPRSVTLYDTRRRSLEPLQPLDGDRVKIYTCGFTLYAEPHIGNYRTYIFEDVLVKALRHFGYVVQRVMNITDVGHLTSDGDEGEDKLEVGARREGKTAWEVAQFYEKRFLEDFTALNLERPERLVKATDTIAEQISLIQTMEQGGHTYQIDDGVYFDAATFPNYTELGRLDLAGQQAGARVAVVEGKRHPYDFALWKFSPVGEKRDMQWESPWGTGFPGWHLECSAIAMKELGAQLDIHCGGVDHIPGHHTNEIAQSESATGKRFAQHWCHCDFLLLDGGKMSKSLGNLYTLKDLAEQGIEPASFKLFTYSAHYRSKLNFTWEAAKAAQKSLERLRMLLRQDGQGSDAENLLERFNAALANDMNLPEAVAVLWEIARTDLNVESKQRYAQQVDEILGLELTKVEPLEIPETVTVMLRERDLARAAKDWAASDRLRAAIEAEGYMVKDSTEGSSVLKL